MILVALVSEQLKYSICLHLETTVEILQGICLDFSCCRIYHTMAARTASNNPSVQEALLITVFIAGPYKSAAIKFVFDDSTIPTRYSNKRLLQLLPDSVDNSRSESRCFEFAYLVKPPFDLQILVQFGKESISCLRAERLCVHFVSFCIYDCELNM